MSSVFRAEDLRRFRSRVAVKILDTAHPDEFRKELFRRETGALQRLEHPNIIRILDQGYWASELTFYMVLEWLEDSLDSRLNPMTLGETPDSAWCYDVLTALADALVYAHSEGIVHRDIKPTNVHFDALGTPKLADFGISRLQYELSTGLTVSGFWSAGYAAPEQRRGESGDERSDLYSLGALAFQLLSGHQPPSDGVTEELISKINVLPEARTLLRRLLSLDPAGRPTDAMEVRSVLSTLNSNVDNVQALLLGVGDAAISKMQNLGFVPSTNFDVVAEWLIEEVGGLELRPISATLERSGEVRLLGKNVRFVCRPTNDRRALSIQDVQIPYGPDFEASRQSALSVRIMWQPIAHNELPSVPWDEAHVSARSVTDLLDRLTTHNRRQQIEHSRRRERRAFLDDWERILNVRHKHIEQRRHPLTYSKVTITPEFFTFELPEPAPDDLPWNEGTSIAIVVDDRRNRLLSIGSLISVNGTTVTVARDFLRLDDKQDIQLVVPDRGTVCMYVSDELVTLKREQSALRQLSSGEASNPRLVEVLTDVSRSEHNAPAGHLEFVQRNLATDKQEAVRQALASTDLFLIQGPPGTGKTTVIAELIAQILKEDPHSRILVTSQSNVPINHVLSKVGSLYRHTPVEIVRLGRADKITQGAEVWQLEQRLAAWREEIVTHCEQKRVELMALTRQRAQQRRQSLFIPEEDLQLCKEWLQEAVDQRQSLRDEEERLGLLRSEQTSAALQNGADIWAGLPESELNALMGAVDIRRHALKGHVEAIHGLLPDSHRGLPQSELDAEIDRLQGVVLQLSMDDTTDPVRAQRQLVDEWITVFGRTQDFELPLLQRANIVAATCLYSGGRVLRNDTYDWVIVDEAGKATATELLVPLVRARRAILVGDERQLPPHT